MAESLLVAQLTDLHVVAAGAHMGGFLDTNDSASRAVAHLNGMTPVPDVVLVTGDLVDTGEPAQYRHARTILEELKVPYWVIPGNHDRRTALMEVFSDRAGSAVPGAIAYAVDDFEVRLIGLDTLEEGHEEGTLDAGQLEWLDRELAGQPDRPTMIFMHHPPFDSGVWWMDTGRLASPRALAEVVKRHRNVVHIICGHVHRPFHRPWAGTMVSVGPSTAFQVDLDLEFEARPRAALEPPACHLHRFDGEYFVTHFSLIDAEWPRVELADLFGDWETTKARWRDRRARLG